MKKLTVVLAGLVMALALALPGGAHAATFTVDSTADVSDANPGDGVCDDGAGNCTLRAAIEEANALAGADTITLPAGTYTLTGGELQISDDLTISGAGQATTFVDGGLVARVFRISSGTVEISGVTIQNGAPIGGGGGGIFNDGTMTLTDVTVSGNSTTFGGGGIANGGGTMTLTNVTVSGNSASTSGGGIVNSGTFGTMTLTNVTVTGNSANSFGGGIFNSATMELTDVTVSGNSATGIDGGGGGIFNFGPMTLTDVTVSDNTANVDGGGILNFSTMTLTDVTVSGNSAVVSGGGIANGGTMTLTNVTVTGNSAGGGGGIFNGGGIVNGGTMTLTNVTVTGNSANSFGGGIFNSDTMELTDVTVSGNTATISGGGIVNTAGFVLNNSIIANSTPDNCSGFSAITSDGHNLEDADSCGLTALGDLTNTDPLLGSLQDNGGSTKTHALLPGSPAIDAIPVADCTDPLGNPITTDQRGVARPQGTACDIGAFEFESPVGGLVVDLDGGPLSAERPSGGGGAGRLASTVVGSAALAVTLTGAAWYARRRL